MAFLTRTAGLVLIGLALAAGACRGEEPAQIPPGVGMPVAAACPPNTSAGYFFSAGALDPDRDDAFEREWFGRFLSAAGVPALSCGSQPETYRLLWLPSFRAAYQVTVARGSGRWMLTAAEFVDPRFEKGERNPFRIAGRTSRPLTKAEGLELIDSLTTLRFWSAPGFQDNAQVDDGWTLVLEGRREQAYRALTRMNINDVPFATAARTLIRLARLPVPRPIDDLADGVGTPRVDPWAKLKYKTAWVVLGGIDDHTGAWATTLTFARPGVGGSPDTKIPVRGEVIQMTDRTELIILGYQRTGESRRLESPADTAMEDEHSAGAVLPVGSRVVVEEVRLDRPGLNLQMVWARVSPQ